MLRTRGGVHGGDLCLLSLLLVVLPTLLPLLPMERTNPLLLARLLALPLLLFSTLSLLPLRLLRGLRLRLRRLLLLLLLLRQLVLLPLPLLLLPLVHGHLPLQLRLLRSRCRLGIRSVAVEARASLAISAIW